MLWNGDLLASLSSSGFSDILLVAWNWPWWKYLHHRNRQILQMKAILVLVLFFWKPILKCLAVHHWRYPWNQWMKKESVWKPNTQAFSTLPGQNHVAGHIFQRPPQSRLPHLLCPREDFMVNWVFWTTENYGQTEGGWKCFSPGLNSGAKCLFWQQVSVAYRGTEST